MTVSQTTAQSDTAWTFDEVLEHLEANPNDTCLQYLAMVLSARVSKRGATSKESIDAVRSRLARSVSLERGSADLFSIFGGAAAVQESLQLDALSQSSVTQKATSSARATESIDQLSGPTIQSHPWSEMLKGRHPNVSRLSKLVPADFYVIESRSARKLLEALSAGSSWQDYLINQIGKQSIEQNVVEQIQKQLLIDAERLELLTSEHIDEICLAGSDLYLADGSDVSLMVASSKSIIHELFRGIASKVAAFGDGLTCDYFDYRGIDCVAITTDDRKICTYAANPFEDIHLRSNSRAALQRILDATVFGAPSLGSSDEFLFVRTLMPYEEKTVDDDIDVFIYFSDAFIRNLVGPRTRIAQRRRKICHCFLKMIDSSILLYGSQECKIPTSLEELRMRECITITESEMACPEGGTYSLADDRNPLPHGICSVHGDVFFLKPILETQVQTITTEESEAYTTFVKSYNQYWRTYFDPIGFRITMKDREYRAQTIVLPLIGNTVYSGLSMALAGPAEILKSPAVDLNTIFGTTIKLNSQSLKPMAGIFGSMFEQSLATEFDTTISQLLSEGLGNQVSFQVLDAHPTFSLDIAMLFGMALAATSGQTNRGAVGTPVWLAALATSLQMPVYATIDVKDIDVVDGYLNGLSKLFRKARTMLPVPLEYSRAEMDESRIVHILSSSLGPLRLRLCIERIGQRLCISTQPHVLDLLHCETLNSEKECTLPIELHRRAHALLSLAPSNWDKVREETCLTWRERNREACHKNLGYLTVYARALDGVRKDSVMAGDLSEAVRKNGNRLCPERGIYTFNSASRCVECDIHGTIQQPKQAGHNAQDESIPLFQVDRAQAILTFIEDGLHGEVVLRLK